MRRVVDAAASRLMVVSIAAAKEPLDALARGLALGGSGAVLADVLRLSMGQRMLPRLCPACRSRRELTAVEREELAGYGLEDKQLFTAVGCRECKGRGYSGLTPLYWAIEPAPWLTELIRKGATAAELRQGALADAMNWPITAALDLALGGEIDIGCLVRLRQEGPPV